MAVATYLGVLWNVLRVPCTPVGDSIDRGPPRYSVPQHIGGWSDMRVLKDMRRGVLCLALLAPAGCVQTAVIPQVSNATVARFDAQSVNPIAIERVVNQVPRGQQIGTLKLGLLCMPHLSLNAGSGQWNVTDASYLQAITQEFSRSEYPITTSPIELFATKTSDATRLKLAARITDIKSNVCFPMGGFGDFSNGTAEAYVQVEWQILDSKSREIVLRFVSAGQGAVTSSTTAPGVQASDLAMAGATRNLLASPEFQRVARNSALR